MESMEYFPWMKSVHQAFSRTFPTEYTSESLKLLNKHLEEEHNKTMNTNVDNLKKFHACLRDLYNHFCWKIDWQKESQAMKACCVKILSYLIKTGILVSKGKPTSKWINRVLAAMRLFPGEYDLLCDALLLLQKLKTTCYTTFAIILRHFLYTNQVEIKNPSTYFKTLMLIRRLKFLTTDKYEKSKLVSFAARTHGPTNSLSWLTSQRIPHLPKINNKNLVKIILSKKLSPKVLKSLRNILLSGMYFENDKETVVPKESFIIDSGMLIENDTTNNAVKKKNKRTNKRSLKNASQSLSELYINDFECNSFIPKKMRKSSEIHSQELLPEFNYSISTDRVQTIKSLDNAGSSFVDQKSTLKKRRKKRKSIENTENNSPSELALVNVDSNADSAYGLQDSPRKYKKLTNRKSKSIEMREENTEMNNSNISLEQLFIIDNNSCIDSENTKVQSNNVLNSNGYLEKYSSRESSPISADLPSVEERELLHEGNLPNDSSYEILKNTYNLKENNFLEQTKMRSNSNTSEVDSCSVENYAKEESNFSTKLDVTSEVIHNSLGYCDIKVTEGTERSEILKSPNNFKQDNFFDKKELKTSSNITKTENFDVNNSEKEMFASVVNFPEDKIINSHPFFNTDKTKDEEACKILVDETSSPSKFKENNFLNQNELETRLSVTKTEIYDIKITSKEKFVSSKGNSSENRTLSTFSSCDSEIISGNMKLERISEEKQLTKLNDFNEKDLNDSNPLQIELQSATKAVLSNSVSSDSLEKCRENFPPDINNVEENFKSKENKLSHSDMEGNNLMNTSEFVSKNLLNDMCEKISFSHKNCEQLSNSNNTELLSEAVDLPESLLDSAACSKINSTEMKIGDIEAVKLQDISLLNSNSFDDVSNETQNSSKIVSNLNENSNLCSKEENLSCIKHTLSKTSARIENENNTLNEELITHFKSNVSGNIEENQLCDQLSLKGFETMRSDEKINTELLDNYIKKVLNKMVDKVANKMDNAAETSSFETLKEKMLKEGFTPLKFPPICKISKTLSNYNADNLKTEGVSLKKIENSLSFSDVLPEHLKHSKTLGTVSSYSLNESINKDFFIYRDIFHDLKEDMSDSVSCTSSPEKESENSYQDNHSSNDSEAEIDIISLEQSSDIEDMENNLTSFIPVAEKNDIHCTQSSDQDISISEERSTNVTKFSEMKNQFYKVPELSPQNTSNGKTFLPEEIEKFTTPMLIPVVNLGKRCDNKDIVMNQIKIDEVNCLDIEKKENRSSVHKEIENTTFKNIEKEVISSEINENKQEYSEEIIDDVTLKGLFEHEFWEEDCSHSENMKLEKCSRKLQNVSNFTQPDTSETDLSQKETVTTLSVLEAIEKEPSIKSSVEITEVVMELDSKEPFADISAKSKSTIISCDSETFGKKSNVELPIEIKEVCIQLDRGEVTKNLESKKNEKSSELLSMNLRKHQTSNCQTDLLTKETISAIPESQLLEISKLPNEMKELSVPLVAKPATESTVQNTSEGSIVLSPMKLRKRHTSKNQTELPVDETILVSPTSKSLENKQNDGSLIQLKEISEHLESNQDIKDIVPKICEEACKSTNMTIRKHTMKRNEKNDFFLLKSKNRRSLRSSKRLESISSNLCLSADLSQLCLDSPSSKRSSKFKPLGIVKNVQEGIHQNQSVECKKLNDNSSEVDTVLAHDSNIESKPQKGYNLRVRKSIIVPGKLKF